MKEANLSYAKLIGAKLRGTDLTNAELNKTDISGAIFKNTNVTSANLTEAIGLTAEQLNKACVSDPNSPPKLPPKLANQGTVDWNNKICVSLSACEHWKNG